MLKAIKRSWAAAALVLAVAATGFTAPPPVLDQVPAESIVVVSIKDLKGLSTKAGNLATRMGLPMVPADMLGMVALQLQINKGLDQNGSAAFFSVLPPEPKEGEIAPVYQKPFVLLLPTTDAKAMTAAFKPTAAENGISEVTVPDAGGETGYIASVGNYVAFAQDRDFLQFYLANKNNSITSKLTAPSVKAYEDNDLVIYINTKQFGPRVIKQMDALKPMIKGMMVAARQPGMTDTEVALQQNYVELGFNVIRQALNDEESSMVTLRLSDAGITLGSFDQFKPGSEYGKVLGTFKPLGADALNGLMPGTVLAAGAVNWDAATMSRLMNGYFQPILDAIKANNDPNAEALQSSIQAMSDALTMTSGMKVALYEPKGDQTGLYHGVMITQTTQPQKYIDLQHEVYKNNMKPFESISPGMKISMTIDPAGLDADGVHFFKSTLNMTPDPERANTQQGLAVAKVLTLMYGEKGVDICQGAIGSSQVLTTYGLGSSQVEAAAVAAHAKSDALAKAPEFATAGKEIVPNAFGVAYLPVDSWFSTAMRLMGGPNAPANAAVVGPATPPIAFSVAATSTSSQSELHIPTATLASVVQRIWSMMGPTAGGPMAVPPPQN